MTYSEVVKMKNLIKDNKKDAKVSWVAPLIGLTLLVCVVNYGAYLYRINHYANYWTFENIQFGTDLDVYVSERPESFQYLRRWFYFEDFVNTALHNNCTVYWDRGNLFWAWFPEEYNTSDGKQIGFFYEVPFKWWD